MNIDNLVEKSKTKDGREDLVKQFTNYGANNYLRDRDDECWSMFNNTGDDKEFEFLTQVGEFALPAKIRRIPIQRTKANILLSQQSLRTTKYDIKIIDGSGMSGKITRMYQAIMGMYAQMLNQKYRTIEFQMQQIDQQVQQMQQQLEQEPQDAQQAQQQEEIRQALPQIVFQTTLVKDNMQQALKMTKDQKDKFLRKFKDDYEDLYEVYSHKLFNKLRQDFDTKKVSLKNFRNKLVVGRQFYYVNFNHRLNELEYGSKNPYIVYYPNIEDIDWVQDCPWVIIETHMTKEQIRNNFTLNATELKLLEAMNFSQTSSQGSFVSGPGQTAIIDNDRTDTNSDRARKFQTTGQGILVRMVWWRADFKLQAIQSPNKYEEGKKFTTFLDDREAIDIQQHTYDKEEDEYVNKEHGNRYKKKNVNLYNSKKGQTKETRFYDKRFFGANIGNGIVLSGEDRCQPHPKDNYGYTPLPIYGRTHNGIGEHPYSIIWATSELQKQYWIVMYHRELTFALAGASGVVFDLSQKPDGMSKEEWFYHMKLGRYLIQTISKTGQRKNTGYNQFSKVDQTLTASIQYFQLILDGIEGQIGTLMGIPRQRQGEVVATDQVGTFDQSNRQAALVTEIMFSEHDEVEGKALEALLNLAMQYKYKPGEIIDVSEEEVKMIQIPWDMPDRKFRMKILNSAKQDLDLEEVKRMSAQMTASGNLPFEFLFKIFSIDSIKEMEHLVAEQTQKQQEIAQLQAQGTVEAEAAAEQKKIQMEQQFEAQMKGMELKLKEAQMKIEAQLKAQELALKSKEVDAKIQQAAVDTAAKVGKDQIDTQIDIAKHQETVRANQADEILKKVELELEALLKSTGVSQGLGVG